MSGRVSAGRPFPLGVTPDADGANVAVASANATRVELCLFDAAGRETARLPLPERTGAVRHGHVAGLAPGALYGFRAHGPFAPDDGHRFNRAKLLLDPCARAFTEAVRWSPALRGDMAGDPRRPDGTDSAPFLPKCILTALPPPIDPAERPATPWERTVICEAHVKNLTRLDPAVPEALRGTFDALAHPAVIDRLSALGVTALELMPVHAFMDEPRLTELGLVNHWGYNSYGFFAPTERWFGPSGAAGLRRAVQALHAAGIEVILDVVYNHSAEGGAGGPTFLFRGLDNALYHRLDPAAPGGYANDTGCGNTLDLSAPEMQRLVLDSLRFWAERIGVDGFRFDLAPVLGREEGGFDAGAGFLDALRQDPVLAPLKMIAEPWDIGPNGYRVGAFPAGWGEWNDGFRDGARGFWRGDPQGAQALAAGLLGSADRFDHSGRPAWSSINFVAAHDGRTLADLTMFERRRNEANGEENRDGHADEAAENFGVEGPSDEPAVRAARARRMRALLATALVAQGTPMIRAGDEIGQSQGGNNNVYCQDNGVSWIDWASGDADLLAFARAVVALRARLPALRQRRFLHDAMRADGLAESAWLAPGGGAPDWDDPTLSALVLVVRGAAGETGCDDPSPVLIALNAAGAPATFAPPPPGPGLIWRAALDTSAPNGAPGNGPVPALPAQALMVFEAVAE